MTFDRFLLIFLTTFVAWALIGLGPAIVATYYGHQWVLAVWFIPIFACVVVLVVSALVSLWKES